MISSWGVMGIRLRFDGFCVRRIARTSKYTLGRGGMNWANPASVVWCLIAARCNLMLLYAENVARWDVYNKRLFSVGGKAWRLNCLQN